MAIYLVNGRSAIVVLIVSLVEFLHRTQVIILHKNNDTNQVLLI